MSAPIPTEEYFEKMFEILCDKKKSEKDVKEEFWHYIGDNNKILLTYYVDQDLIIDRYLEEVVKLSHKSWNSFKTSFETWLLNEKNIVVNVL